jgi:hypothetical protein
MRLLICHPGTQKLLTMPYLSHCKELYVGKMVCKRRSILIHHPHSLARDDKLRASGFRAADIMQW